VNKPKRKRRFKQPPGKVFRNGRWVTFNEAARMQGFKNTYARLVREAKGDTTR
jgi:hypothetical protein